MPFEELNAAQIRIEIAGISLPIWRRLIPARQAPVSRKRSSFPITVSMEEQLAMHCEQALQVFGARLCNRLVEAGARVSVRGWRQLGFEGPGHQLVDA